MRFRHIVLAVFLAAVLVGVDNLVPRLDWSYMNRNGWLMYFAQLIPWTALVISPALLFGRFSRVLYYPAVTVLVVVETVTMFVRWQFKVQMDGAWLAILTGSSPNEMLAFVGRYWGVSFVVTALFIAAFGLLVLRTVSHLKDVRMSLRNVLLGLVCLGVFLLATPFRSAPLKTLESRTSVFFLTDALRKWESWRALVRMKNAPELPAGLCRAAGADGSLAGVFVLGESATRSRWHLYGYPRLTTPCVEALGRGTYVFSNVTAAAVFTAQAIPMMMATATRERPNDLRYSLSQALASLGFRQSLFSNQERMGKDGSPETYVFAGCGEMVFLSETVRRGRFYDDALQPYLAREMSAAATNAPKVVFLHLAGSHMTVSERYPSAFAPFRAQPMRRSGEWQDMKLMSDHYDNSIAFTDRLLGEVVQSLRARGGPAWMIYVPDHGETPDAPGWRTVTSADLWEIPMVVWLSDDYRRRFPQVVARLDEMVSKPLRTDRLLALFLAVAGAEVK